MGRDGFDSGESRAGTPAPRVHITKGCREPKPTYRQSFLPLIVVEHNPLLHLFAGCQTGHYFHGRVAAHGDHGI